MSDKTPFVPQVSLLTAGKDPHYSLGLADALNAAGMPFDFIGGDDAARPERWPATQGRFLNLRGEQGEEANLRHKVSRVVIYYFRLLIYAATSRAKIFHILWNNKFELFDRTLLMAIYKLLGKKTALTAHNINAAARDGGDGFLNRVSLKFQYRLSDAIFVHTRKMKDELISEFGVAAEKVVIIPYGLNDTVPHTALTTGEARQRLGLGREERVILFFGNIAPYKGLEFLVEAFGAIANEDPLMRLVIAGRPKGPREYWEQIQVKCDRWRRRILQKIEYLSDADTELHFKAADVLVMPYVHIFQSGVLSIAYSYGLPVIVADVGSFKEEIVEGQTGFVFEPKNPAALAGTIRGFFRSDLYRQLESRRREIRRLAFERCSWDKVAAITTATYGDLLHGNKRRFSKSAAPQKPTATFAEEKL